LHVLHRELYLIPIGFAGYWFGARAGLTTALVAVICFLPRVLMPGHGGGTYLLNNVLAIATFVLVGYLVGKYHDARKGQFMTTRWEPRKEQMGKGSFHVLLCIDNSKNAYKAAQYAANTYARSDRTAVTIMGFIREPSVDIFADSEEHAKAKADMASNVQDLVGKAEETLRQKGVPADMIKTSTLTLQRESVAARILEEQRRSHYDTIVVGGSKMSKTEEFLFGNVAVKLVREADCPVVTVF